MPDQRSWSLLAQILENLNLGPIPAHCRMMRVDPSICPELRDPHFTDAQYRHSFPCTSGIISREIDRLRLWIQDQYWAKLRGSYSLEPYGGFSDSERQRRWAMACERLYEIEAQKIMQAAVAEGEDTDVGRIGRQVDHALDRLSLPKPTTILDQAFARNPFPTASERAILSQSTGLDYKRVSSTVPA